MNWILKKLKSLCFKGHYQESEKTYRMGENTTGGKKKMKLGEEKYSSC